MKKPKDLKPSTLSLHAGQRPDTDFGARATPIYQSSSFVFLILKQPQEFLMQSVLVMYIRG